MRRGLGLLALGVLVAAFGAASARADAGTGTTTGATTTGTTTTTPAPSYASLSPSLLPAGCVGAGAAALAPPGHPVVALGTPASNLGPSAYSASVSALAFSSSRVSGSTCTSASITLASVSLFGGAVTATSVQATDGRGAATGLEIDGTPVSASSGQTVPVEGWGQLTLGGTVGRVRAPLVLWLLQSRGSLPAGTSILVGFAATATPVTKPAPAHASAQTTHHVRTTHAAQDRHSQSGKPPPDFPSSRHALPAAGVLGRAARSNAIVASAMQYLGVPYRWGGASPQTGFDCSGLVTYVFGRLGVSLPHYVAAQWYSPDAVWVRPDRLQPGDLVFFTGSDGTRKMPGHVGIYVGNGYLIDAPRTGSFVRIDSLDDRWFADEYVGAKRIVGAQTLAARHLSHTSTQSASTAPISHFPLPLGLQGVGDPTRVAATATTTYRMWPGAPLGGLVLLLLAGAALVFGPRSHAPDTR